MKPDKVVILGKTYAIQYVDNPSDVDYYHREALFGQVDFWTCSIRIYDNGRHSVDILSTLFHEVLHGISENLHLKCFDGERGHEDMDLIALALADVMTRNGWINERHPD